MPARVDYTPITELPGTPASREQLAIAFDRYRTAARLCDGRDVLEVACGGGQGLRYLAGRARRVVGGDIVFSTLQVAHEFGSQSLVQFDAHHQPFADASFDVVLLFEAIYYLADVPAFLRECRRVLRPGGYLIISSVNRQWTDFNPSPFSTRYYSADELADLLSRGGFEPQITVAFPDHKRSLGSRGISAVRRVAIRLRLIPKSFRYKALLKRIFYGTLTPMPTTFIQSSTPTSSAVSLSDQAQIGRYKVIYCLGKLMDLNGHERGEGAASRC